MTGPAVTGVHAPPWVAAQAGQEDCPWCGATPGDDCTCGPGSKHLARFARAVRADRISARDLGCLIPDSQPFSGATIIPDPEATP